MTSETPREDSIREAAARVRRAAASLESVAFGADDYLPPDAERRALDAAIAAELAASELLELADEVAVSEFDDELDAFFFVARGLLRERGRKRTGAVAVAKEAARHAKEIGRDDFLPFLTTDRARAWLRKNTGD